MNTSLFVGPSIASVLPVGVVTGFALRVLEDATDDTAMATTTPVSVSIVFATVLPSTPAQTTLLVTTIHNNIYQELQVIGIQYGPESTAVDRVSSSESAFSMVGITDVTTSTPPVRRVDAVIF